jgi:hypothetical protein
VPGLAHGVDFSLSVPRLVRAEDFDRPLFAAMAACASVYRGTMKSFGRF